MPKIFTLIISFDGCTFKMLNKATISYSVKKSMIEFYKASFIKLSKVITFLSRRYTSVRDWFLNPFLGDC